MNYWELLGAGGGARAVSRRPRLHRARAARRRRRSCSRSRRASIRAPFPEFEPIAGESDALLVPDMGATRRARRSIGGRRPARDAVPRRHGRRARDATSTTSPTRRMVSHDHVPRRCGVAAARTSTGPSHGRLRASAPRVAGLRDSARDQRDRPRAGRHPGRALRRRHRRDHLAAGRGAHRARRRGDRRGARRRAAQLEPHAPRADRRAARRRHLRRHVRRAPALGRRVRDASSRTRSSRSASSPPSGWSRRASSGARRRPISPSTGASASRAARSSAGTRTS